ncbi:trigger factor [Oscillibacter valericigenes]|uniref:trigger factor n=1 Tax=Oscillibacter valericigenes TaxID=351091 RepID=UPI001F173A23|nr:trigger factor [Oscillibacter valericigenes]MCF2664253.1 trigger factor [Oscillibacter valericigenes]
MSLKSCEKIEKSQVVLTIEVGSAEFEAAIEKAYQKMRKKINVPGFRPGKAPRKVIEGMYGAEVFFEEAINIAFPEAYEAAVKEKELQVVGYPAVEMVGECTKEGFTFTATTPVYPEVTLGEYKGLTAEKDEVKVGAADVNERLKLLQDRNTRLVSVDREAKEGDTAVIDFEGFLNGVPFDGGKGEGHNLELGSHSFVPGFEEQVVGMKAGEEKDLDITFPEDYHADLAGKAVVFKVKVNEVKAKEVPELDDEFAKDVSEFDTLKDLKADLKKQITEERQKDADRAFEDAVMEQAAANITAEIPDAMVETQCRQFLDNFKMQIAQQGIPYEQYMQITGMDEAKLLEDAKEPALRQVKMDLTVAAIIKAENLDATDEEVEAEYKKLAEQYNMDIEMVKKYLPAEQIKDQLVSQKAVAVVVDSANVVVKKAPAKKTTKKTTKKADAEAEVETTETEAEKDAE